MQSGLRVAAAVMILGSLQGCVSASLASDTGPRQQGHRWSTEARQQAHVGEEVRFDFVLQDASKSFLSPTGVADYCVAMIGKRRIESEPDEFGHFTFTDRFDDARAGDEVAVRAIAYEQQGSRDFIRVGGQWLEADSPYAVADRKVAEASVVLSFYQSKVDLGIARPADDLDPETGVLRIRHSEGSIATVYVDRPNRKGFVIAGPGADGFYHVSYLPRGDEVDKTGTTEVEFSIYDLAGQRHTVAQSLPTP